MLPQAAPVVEQHIRFSEKKISDPKPIKKKYNTDLQAFRGILAVFVVIHHICEYQNYLDPNFYSKNIDSFQPRGTLRVLIFFVLSGYVIGLSNKKRIGTNDILPFLKKRLVRLYPLYVIGLLLALIVASTSYSFQTIAGNLTFTQVIFSGLIDENLPMWSLQYEIFYLLLFIPISFFNINPIFVGIFSLLLGIANYYFYPQLNSPIITSYSFGMLYWASGLAMSKYIVSSHNEKNFTLFIGVIPLIFCLYRLNIFSVGFDEFSKFYFGSSMSFPSSIVWYERPIGFVDLTYLPYCLMFVLVFAGNDFKYRKQIFFTLLILPSFTLLYMLNNIEDAGDIKKILILAIPYGLSLLICFSKIGYLDKVSQYLIRKSVWLGDISYSVFIIHFPLFFIFKKVDFFSGSLLTFIVRVIIYIAITLLCSYILEKKFYPQIKKRFL